MPNVISNVQILESKLFNVFRATIEQDDLTYTRDVIVHPGSAVVVPVFADGSVALVRQYRQAAAEFLLELPAGSLEKGESPEEGAAREVAEEIGFKAGKLEYLTEFFVSPGFLSEKMYVYLATDLVEVGQNLDEDEQLNVEILTFREIYQMIGRGDFADAKTMLSLILAGTKLGFPFENAAFA